MSLPSGPIQQLAPGFLSVLNLKNKGLLPDVLNGVVQPTLDLEEYFLRGAVVEQAAAAQACGISPGAFFPTGAGLLVPANETWYVEAFTAATRTPAAADQLSICPSTRFNVGAAVVNEAIAPQVRSTGIAARLISLARGFWLPPGAELGFWVEGTTAGAVVVDSVTRFARFRV